MFKHVYDRGGGCPLMLIDAIHCFMLMQVTFQGPSVLNVLLNRGHDSFECNHCLNGPVLQY